MRHVHVGRQRELEQLQEVDHARTRHLGRFRTHIIGALTLVDVRKHVVEQLQQLQRRQFVE
jgi:hypothetical protein